MGIGRIDIDLSVGVVVAVVVADADELGDVGRSRLGHLRGKEVAESFAGESVNVVDGIIIPVLAVDKDPRSRRHIHLHRHPINKETKKPRNVSVSLHHSDPAPPGSQYSSVWIPPRIPSRIPPRNCSAWPSDLNRLNRDGMGFILFLDHGRPIEQRKPQQQQQQQQTRRGSLQGSPGNSGHGHQINPWSRGSHNNNQ